MLNLQYALRTSFFLSLFTIKFNLCFCFMSFFFIFPKGFPLDVVGTPSDPWKLKANLVLGSGSDSKAVLTGQTEISFKNGWANFTTLSISLKGTNYGLEFNVVYPTAAQFKATSPPNLDVPARPLTLSLIPRPQRFIANQNVDLRVYLKDQVTGATVSDSKWRVSLIWFLIFTSIYIYCQHDLL